MKCVVKTSDELKLKKWISPPGEPGMSFCCSQILRHERLKHLDAARVTVLNEDGDAIEKSDGSTVERYTNESLYNGTKEILMSHIFDWKGDDLIDTNGKPVKFSKENLEAFIDGCGAEKITLEDGTETDLMSWLSRTMGDPNSFIDGDVKNLKTS